MFIEKLRRRGICSHCHGILFLVTMSLAADMEAMRPALASNADTIAAVQGGTSVQVEAQSPRTFKIGPRLKFRKPSDVVKLVRSGDRVEIAPGTYADCAIWPKEVDGLVIEGRDVTLVGVTCQDKGIFVVSSSNVVIRGITFAGAKSSYHNGAGIRAQGQNLTVENSRFINNENGILGSAITGSTIIVRNSFFRGNGACIAACAHGVYVDWIGRLRVEGSEFVDTHYGHHIKSRALQTEIVDNIIHDGPRGDSSYLIDLPQGGDIVITGNRLEKGPRSENKDAAISVGEAAAIKGTTIPTPQIRVENNKFSNDLPNPTIFLRNSTGTAAVLRNNILEGRVMELVEPGA